MNYSEIISTALSYSDRVSDTEVSARIDMFLRMVESRTNRLLMVQKMSIRAYLDTVEGAEYYTLPSDFNGIRDIEIRDSLEATNRVTLQYISPEQMNAASTNSNNLQNIYYTIIANQIQIMPIQPADKVLEVIYYRGISPLSSASITNWLSNYFPDVYLFGLLTEISAFVKDIPSTKMWDSRYKEAVADIDNNDYRTRWSGTALQVRIG